MISAFQGTGVFGPLGASQEVRSAAGAGERDRLREEHGYPTSPKASVPSHWTQLGSKRVLHVNMIFPTPQLISNDAAEAMLKQLFC